MPLNLVEICTVKYPGQIEAGNITFRKPENDILFATWNVEGIEQPEESEIMAEAQQWERPILISVAFEQTQQYVENLLDEKAKEKQYGSAIACTSYATSTNTQWKAEAEAFIAWRDAVFSYAINLQTQIEQGGEIPTLEQFISGLPRLQWPE